MNSNVYIFLNDIIIIYSIMEGHNMKRTFITKVFLSILLIFGMLPLQTVSIKANDTCVVTIDNNNGETPIKEVIDRNSSFILPNESENAPAGTVFGYWIEGDITGDWIMFNPGDSPYITEDTTFTAIWIEVEDIDITTIGHFTDEYYAKEDTGYSFEFSDRYIADVMITNTSVGRSWQTMPYCKEITIFGVRPGNTVLSVYQEKYYDGEWFDRYLVGQYNITVEKEKISYTGAPLEDYEFSFIYNQAPAIYPDLDTSNIECIYERTKITHDLYVNGSSYETYTYQYDCKLRIHEDGSYQFNIVSPAIGEMIEVSALIDSDPSEATVIQASSLVLEGVIQLQFRVLVPEAENKKIVIKFEGENASNSYENSYDAVKKRHHTQETSRGTEYYYRVPVYAKQMNDNVTIWFTNKDGNKVKFKTGSGKDVTESGYSYSVAQYISNKWGGDNVELSQLVRSMRYYGIYAQLYFNYETDLAEAILAGTGPMNDVDISLLEPYVYVKAGTAPTGLSVASFSLTLEDDVRINYKLNVADGIKFSDYTIKLDGNNVTPVKASDGYWYIYKSNIAAKDLDTMHELVISDGNKTISYKYGALTYCYNMISKSGTADTLKNLCKAIYWYNVAADNYLSH